MGDNITDLILQNTTVLDFLSPEITANLGILITILKTLGIIAIVYIIFLITTLILNLKRVKILKKTYEKIEELEKKVDKLLAEKNHKK